jgi:hypothetical protein
LICRGVILAYADPHLGKALVRHAIAYTNAVCGNLAITLRAPATLHQAIP